MADRNADEDDLLLMDSDENSRGRWPISFNKDLLSFMGPFEWEFNVETSRCANVLLGVL